MTFYLEVRCGKRKNRLNFEGDQGLLSIFFKTSLLVTCPTHTRPHGSGLGTRGISFEFTHTSEITH